MKMNRIIVSIVFFSIMLTSALSGQTKLPKKSIEKFILSYYTSTVDDSDSLRVSVFLEIPYYSLQYVKRDTQFIAQYEAAIAIQTKKGNQLGRQLWQDSIIVNSYSDTRSLKKNRTLMASYKIPSGKYKIIGTLLDKDTKKTGRNSHQIDMTDYKKKRFLHKPILLEEFDGNWGFGEGLIPAVHNSTFNIENGLKFYITGKAAIGHYVINLNYLDKENNVLFSDSINDSTENGYFKHLVNLPKDEIEGISIKINAELVQKSHKLEQQAKVVLRKAGISHLVHDIDEALLQMNYILSSKERKKVRKTSTLKSEKLFRDLWKERDPTPGTTVNELMNEYYSRVNFANVHFGGFRDGWETDRGMVYIIMGPPDDIDKYIDDQYQEPYEAWYYNRIQETYIFIGDNFGNYTLLTPFLGYRR